jgi:hypothetical protein
MDHRWHTDRQAPVLPDAGNATFALLPYPLDGNEEATVAAAVDYHLACFGEDDAVRFPELVVGHENTPMELMFLL